MKDPTKRAPQAPASGAAAASPIEEFRELSKRYRDVQALRGVSLVALNLSPIAWSIFADIYHHLWGAKEAWPTQALLVQRVGWCERSVRDATRELEEAGFLVVERRRRRAPFGGFKLFYLPGPALCEALRALAQRTLANVGRGAADRPRVTFAEPEGLPSAPPPDPHTSTAGTSRKSPCDRGASGTAPRAHPALHAGDLSPLEILSNPSLHSGPPEPEPPSTPAASGGEETKGDLEVGADESEPREDAGSAAPPALPSLVSLDDARIASELLAHRLWLAHPKATMGAGARGLVLTQAAERVAELGDLEPKEKLRRGKLAVEAAHRRSLRKTGRSPSPGYIFGTEAFFRGHVERGLAEGSWSPPIADAQEGLQEPRKHDEAANGGSPTPCSFRAHGEGARAPETALSNRTSQVSRRDHGGEADDLEERRRTAREQAEKIMALWETEASKPPPVVRVLDADAHARARAELLAEMTSEDRTRFVRAEALARKRSAIAQKD